MSDAAARVRANPQFRAVRRALWQKWRRLANDKEFIWETARLKLHLSIAVDEHPTAVRSFFKPVFNPSIFNERDVRKGIARFSDPQLRRLLTRYVRFVFRFGVVMRLEKKRPYFRAEAIPPDPNPTFHVKVRKGNLEPAEPFWWDGQTPISDFFSSSKVAQAPELRKLIEAGCARYVQIDDQQKGSLFRQLTDFAYSSDQLTFVLVNAQQPYIFCLIGEDISVDDTWRNASKTVAEFQDTHYKRTRAGRPPDWRRLHRELSILLRNDATLKWKAIVLMEREGLRDVPEKKFKSQLSALSQLRRKLRL